MQIETSDAADNSQTIYSLTVGDRFDGNIADTYDIDWIAVDLVAGTEYIFSLDETLPVAGFDAYFYLSESDGAVTSAFYDEFENVMVFSPTSSDRYFLDISAFTTGDYAIEMAVDDLPGNATTPATLTPDTTVTGVLQYTDDKDWIAVDLEAGRTYFFSLDDTLTVAPIDGELSVKTPNGAGTTATYDQYYNVLTYSPTVTGRHFVEVTSSFATGGFAVSMGVDDLPGDTTTPATIAVGETFQGSVDYPEDTDWIAVDLVAGTEYIFSLNPDLPVSGIDASFYLMRPNGVTTADSIDSYYDAIIYNPDSSGTYYLGVSSYLETGAYEILMATDVPAGTNSTAVVIPGEVYEGTYDYQGDEDWIGIDLEYGKTYAIRITGVDAPDPEYVALYSDEYSQAAYLDPYADPPNDEYLIYTVAGTTGRHWIAVYDEYITGEGGYQIEVMLDTANSQATQQTLSDDTPFVDSLDYTADSDWSAMSLKRGEIAVLTLSRAGAGPSMTMKTIENGDEYDSAEVSTSDAEVSLLTARLGSYPMFLDVSADYDPVGAFTVTQTTLGRIAFGDHGSSRIVLQDLTQDAWIDLRGFGAPRLNIDGLGDLQLTEYQYLPSITGATTGAGDDVLIGGYADERFVAGAGNDSVFGLFGQDSIDGGAGDDSIRGGDGNDRLVGGTGDDTVEGGTGNDSTFGAAGNDLLSGERGADWLQGGAGDDTVGGGAGNDTLFGGEGADLLAGNTANDLLKAGNGDDTLQGGSGQDMLYGEDGNDRLVAGGARDILAGGAGSDDLFGGGGDDFLNAGGGFDSVEGGAGADAFYHAGVKSHGRDWIRDFNSDEGDTLVFGGTAVAGDFVVQYSTSSGPGAASIDEAFIRYLPTRQILWTLQDGADLTEISMQVGTEVFDLLG